MESRMAPGAANDRAPPRHKSDQATTAMTMTAAQIVDADINGMSTPAKARSGSAHTNNDTMLSGQSSSVSGRPSGSGSLASSGSASGSSGRSSSCASVNSSGATTTTGTLSRQMTTGTTRDSLDDCELLERYTSLNVELDEMVVKSHRSSLRKRNSSSALASLTNSVSRSASFSRQDSSSAQIGRNSNSISGQSLSPSPIQPSPQQDDHELTSSAVLSPGQLAEMAVLNEARNAELSRLRANSAQMIQCQKELLDKMEKHERNANSYRRFFFAMMNQQQRIDKLKQKLEQKLQESVAVDTKLEQLEREAEPFVARGKYGACCVASSTHPTARRSFSLVQHRNRRQQREDQFGMPRPASLTSLAQSFRGSSSSDSMFGSFLDGLQSNHQHQHQNYHTVPRTHAQQSGQNGQQQQQQQQQEDLDANDEKAIYVKIAQLERERDNVLNGVFRSGLGNADSHQLHTRVAMVGSEIKATQSIYQQVRKCCSMYRQALQRVRTALAAIVSHEYSGTLREFLKTIYPLCIEAGQFLEGAGMVFQPESKRRYKKYANEFIKVQMPRFPGIINDCARRGRTHFDPNSSLMLEGARKLKYAEKNVLTLQRLVLEKMEILEKWRHQAELDVLDLQELHRSLESKLRNQLEQCAERIRKSLGEVPSSHSSTTKANGNSRFRRATSTPVHRANNSHSNNHAVVMAS